MDIKQLAAILLVGRLVSDFFIVLVLRRQWKLRKTKTHPRLMAYRKILAILAVLIFIGNIYPLVLDLLTLSITNLRSTNTVNPVGVVYSLGNNLTFMFASILIYLLYKLSDTVIEIAELVGIKEVKNGTIVSDK
jgi:hypothetical protein